MAGKPKGKFFWLGAAAGALLLVFAAAFIQGTLHNIQLQKQQGSKDQQSGTPSTKIDPSQRNVFSEGHFYADDTNAHFTYPPVALEDITQIVPLGYASSGEGYADSGAGTHIIPSDHMYVRSQPVKKGETRIFKVYAVADAYLVNVPYYKGAWAGPDGTPHMLDSYSLEFQVSKSLFVKITDLTDLTPELKAQIGELSDGTQNFRAIPIKAGTQLGQSGSGDVLNSVDFWTIDFRQPAQYIHPLWHGELDGYSTNPLSYYDEPLRSQLYDKLPVRAEPRAGQFAYDVDGRLVGSWFRLANESDYPEKTPNALSSLGFFYQNDAPDVIEIGYWPNNAVYVVKGNSPDPASIAPQSGLIKYELMRDRARNPNDPSFWRTEVTMLVQMLENRRIRMEIFEGKTASEVTAFDQNAIEFYR